MTEREFLVVRVFRISKTIGPVRRKDDRTSKTFKKKFDTRPRKVLKSYRLKVLKKTT